MSLRALGLGRFGPWRYIVAFTVGVLSICAATAALIHRDYEGAKSEWHSRLGTVAEDRASVVSGYLQSRLQDAEAWADLPIFRICLTPRAGGNGKPQETAHDALDGVLSALNSTYAYPGVVLFDSQGKRLVSTGAAHKFGSETPNLCGAVIRDGAPQIALLDGTSPLLLFVAPVRLHDKAARTDGWPPPVAGVMAIFTDPAVDLFPALEAEPVATRTEESLLIRREGNKAVFLSPLRNLPHSPAVVTLPIQNLDPLVQGGFEGREGVGSSIDYRGAEVIAAVRPISETGWVLEEKIDTREAYEGFRRAARLKALCASLFVLAFGAALVILRRRQRTLKLLGELERHQHLLRAQRYAADIGNSLPAWLLVLTPDFRIQSANQSFLTYLDISEDEIRGLSLGEIIRTERLLRQVGQAMKGQATVEEVLLDVRVRGKEIKLPARVTLADLARGVKGKPEVLLVVEDLTESERLRLAGEAKERELREMEVRYRALAENSADFIGTHDLQGTIVSVTLAVALRAGFKDPEAMVGLKVRDFLSRDRWAEFDAYLETVRREGRAQGMMKAIMPGGEEVMVEFRNSTLGGGREPAVVFCVGRDATELVRMRKALKEAGRLHETSVMTARNGIAGLDSAGLFTFVNERASQISGYTGEELQGRPFSVLFPPEDIEHLSALIRVCLTERVQISGREVTILRKDGGRRTLRLHLTCSRTGIVMAWTDLTEIRAIQARVQAVSSATP
jgi:PAS domain S-box-containing protein